MLLSTRSRRSRRDARGFTLVELLVVIGIIALLISILLPTLSRARESAASVKCLSNMRQMGQFQTLFVNEHDGWTIKSWENSGPYADPDVHAANTVVPKTAPSDRWKWQRFQYGWDAVMRAYVDGLGDAPAPGGAGGDDGGNPPDDAGIFRCPGDPTNKVRGELNDNDLNLGFDDFVPFGPLWDNIPTSYRLNGSNGPDIAVSFKISKIDDPTRAIMLFENNPDSFVHHAVTYFAGDLDNLHPLYPANLASNRHGSDRGLSGDERDPDVYNKRRLNYLFYDGHAAAVTWADTWKPVGEPVVAFDGSINERTMWRQYYAGNVFFPDKRIFPNVAPSVGVWDGN